MTPVRPLLAALLASGLCLTAAAARSVGPRPRPGKPNICVPCCLTIGTRTTAWGDDRTVDIGPGDGYVPSPGMPRLFHLGWSMRNCGGRAAGAFAIQVTFDGKLLGTVNASLGPGGDQRAVSATVQLPPRDGVLKLVVDPGNAVDEEWEGDNTVWVHVRWRPAIYLQRQR